MTVQMAQHGEGVVMFSSKLIDMPLVLVIRNGILETMDGFSPLSDLNDRLEALAEFSVEATENEKGLHEMISALLDSAPASIKTVLETRGSAAKLHTLAKGEAAKAILAEETRQLKEMVAKAKPDDGKVPPHPCENCPACTVRKALETEINAVKAELESSKDEDQTAKIKAVLKSGLETFTGKLNHIIETASSLEDVFKGLDEARIQFPKDIETALAKPAAAEEEEHPIPTAEEMSKLLGVPAENITIVNGGKLGKEGTLAALEKFLEASEDEDLSDSAKTDIRGRLMSGKPLTRKELTESLPGLIQDLKAHLVAAGERRFGKRPVEVSGDLDSLPPQLLKSLPPILAEKIKSGKVRVMSLSPDFEKFEDFLKELPGLAARMAVAED